MSEGPFEPGGEPPKAPTGRWVFAAVGCLVGLCAGVVVIPVLMVFGLTALGNALDGRFEAVQSELCKDHPDDPGCPPR